MALLFQLLIIVCYLIYLSEAQEATSFYKILPDIGILKSCNIDKIYQFGASKSDTGNRGIENPLYMCNSHPYGQSFFGEPTGRCSDGLLMIDYIGKKFHVILCKPYFSTNNNLPAKC